MTQSDDEFLKTLAEKDAQKQRAENQAKDLQLHRSKVLQAKLPLYFTDLHSLLSSKIKSYDQIVQTEGGTSSTQIIETGRHGFQLRHQNDAVQSVMSVSYDLMGQRITYGGHSGPFSNPEQNTLPEIVFTVSVDENDNLLIVRLGARDAMVSMSPANLADDIIRILVER